MKNNLILLFLGILSFPLISYSQNKAVVIRIAQDRSYNLRDFQTDIKLKKRGFKFQLLLDNADGVYVFASIRDSIYRFTDTSQIHDFAYLKLLELREEDKFNTNRELNISEDGWSYWFYNDTTEYHSFNRKTVGLGRKRIIGTKAIKQLYDVGGKTIIKLSEMDKPLYLFFLAVKDYDENGKPKTELMRKKVKIEWDDD